MFGAHGSPIPIPSPSVFLLSPPVYQAARFTVSLFRKIEQGVRVLRSNYPTRENLAEFDFQFTLIRFAYLGALHMSARAAGPIARLSNSDSEKVSTPHIYLISSNPSRFHWLRISGPFGPRPDLPNPRVRHSSTTRKYNSLINTAFSWAPAKSF